MIRSVRSAVAVFALATALMPGSGQALVNSECGGTYAKTSSCMFTAVGPNITVTGSTSLAGVVVRVSDPSDNVRVVECTGQFSCVSSFGIPPTGTDSVGPPPGVGPLRCTVIASGDGYFRCQSTI